MITLIGDYIKRLLQYTPLKSSVKSLDLSLHLFWISLQKFSNFVIWLFPNFSFSKKFLSRIEKRSVRASWFCFNFVSNFFSKIWNSFFETICPNFVFTSSRSYIVNFSNFLGASFHRISFLQKNADTNC